MKTLEPQREAPHWSRFQSRCLQRMSTVHCAGSLFRSPSGLQGAPQAGYTHLLSGRVRNRILIAVVVFVHLWSPVCFFITAITFGGFLIGQWMYLVVVAAFSVLACRGCGERFGESFLVCVWEYFPCCFFVLYLVGIRSHASVPPFQAKYQSTVAQQAGLDDGRKMSVHWRVTGKKIKLSLRQIGLGGCYGQGHVLAMTVLIGRLVFVFDSCVSGCNRVQKGVSLLP